MELERTKSGARPNALGIAKAGAKNDTGKVNRGGRPRALNQSKQQMAALLLSLGLSRKAAAQFIGCAPCTLRREALRDPEFGERLREARHGANAGMLHAIVNSGRHDPSAADWLRTKILTAIDGKAPRAKTSPKPCPPDGSMGAQNLEEFCALAEVHSLVNSPGIPAAPRAKPTVAMQRALAPQRAKQPRLVPADYMSPIEFVMQQRAKQARALGQVRRRRSAARGKKSLLTGLLSRLKEWE
jgi:hypothetical protein